ncbi:hypothetical protein [Mixta gaviniae]|uniref:hypothetical protein n=1 Tax=Mixta gaviniae TaxID=665914 RepID=UPI0011B0E0E9|nr:hypothetical protein [Mixta gaviniae]
MSTLFRRGNGLKKLNEKAINPGRQDLYRISGYRVASVCLITYKSIIYIFMQGAWLRNANASSAIFYRMRRATAR